MQINASPLLREKGEKRDKQKKNAEHRKMQPILLQPHDLHHQQRPAVGGNQIPLSP